MKWKKKKREEKKKITEKTSKVLKQAVAKIIESAL